MTGCLGKARLLNTDFLVVILLLLHVYLKRYIFHGSQKPLNVWSPEIVDEINPSPGSAKTIKNI